jgi:hypothetical protein
LIAVTLKLLVADEIVSPSTGHFVREAAVDAVVAQQVRVGLDRTEIVDRDHSHSSMSLRSRNSRSVS